MHNIDTAKLFNRPLIAKALQSYRGEEAASPRYGSTDDVALDVFLTVLRKAGAEAVNGSCNKTLDWKTGVSTGQIHLFMQVLNRILETACTTIRQRYPGTILDELKKGPEFKHGAEWEWMANPEIKCTYSYISEDSSDDRYKSPTQINVRMVGGKEKTYILSDFLLHFRPVVKQETTITPVAPSSDIVVVGSVWVSVTNEPCAVYMVSPVPGDDRAKDRIHLCFSEGVSTMSISRADFLKKAKILYKQVSAISEWATRNAWQNAISKAKSHDTVTTQPATSTGSTPTEQKTNEASRSEGAGQRWADYYDTGD